MCEQIDDDSFLRELTWILTIRHDVDELWYPPVSSGFGWHQHVQMAHPPQTRDLLVELGLSRLCCLLFNLTVTSIGNHVDVQREKEREKERRKKERRKRRPGTGSLFF